MSEKFSAMPSHDADLDAAVAALLCEFAEHCERGKKPSIDEFVAAHPEYSEQLRKLLPAACAMAELGAASLEVSYQEQSFDSVAPNGMLGDFRLLREVGRGGMGVVYEAEQISLGRRVALKVLPFATVLDPRHLQRFQNEARAAATLDHPHIVHVYSVGQDRGVHYYAMQLVEGQSLAEVVNELRGPTSLANPFQSTQSVHPPEAIGGPVPTAAMLSTAHGSQVPTVSAPRGREHFQAVARWGLQAAEALEYAHQLGVVHRDIKPSNLLVNAGGHLWVADFGLAMTQTDSNLTRTGELLGTLRYMSPEQASGEQRILDHRTDVYSLGITLYELLTLRPAFPATNRQQLLQQVTQDVPLPSRRVRKDIPVDLDTIIAKSTAKDPADRYPTARALADDLQRYLDDKPILARAPSGCELALKWARRHTAALSGVLAGALFAVVLLAVSTTLVIRARDDARRAEKQRGLEAASAIRERNEARRLEKMANEERANADQQRAEAQRRGKHAERNFQHILEIVEETLSDNKNPLLAEFVERNQAQTDELRNALHESAVDFLRGLIVEGSADPVVRRESAIARARLISLQGSMRLDEPSSLEARDQFAIAELTDLAEASPDDSTILVELAKCHLLHIWALHRNRRSDSPPDHFAQLHAACDVALDVNAEIQRRFPELPARDDEMAQIYRIRGRVHQYRREYQLAARDGETAAEHWLRVPERVRAGDGPFRNIYGYSLHYASSALIEAAQNWKRAGNDGAAEQRLRRAIAIGETSLPLKWLDSGNMPSELLYAYEQLLRLQFDRGQFAEAEATLDQMREIIEGAFRALPQDPTKKLFATHNGRLALTGERSAAWRAGRLARNYARYADLDTRVAEKQHALHMAFAIWDHACNQPFNDPLNWGALQDSALSFGQFLRQRGDYGAAIPVLERGKLAGTNLREHRPADITDAEVPEALAECYLRVGRYTEAREACRTRWEIAKWRMAKQDGDFARHSYVRASLALGPLEESQDVAEKLYQDAVRVAESTAEPKPYDQMHGLWIPTVNPAAGGPMCARSVSGVVLFSETLQAYSEFLARTGHPVGSRHQLRRADQVLQSLFTFFDQRSPKQPYQSTCSQAANNLAWFMATSPYVDVHNYRRSAELARTAVRYLPTSAPAWNTRGVADYRCWNLCGALVALHKSMELSSGGGGEDWYFLAMTHWQLGSKHEARRWYDKAEAWLKEQTAPSVEVLRFRDEAAALFAAGDCSPFPPPPSLPEGHEVVE